MTDEGQFSVRELRESSKRAVCHACRRACQTVRELAQADDFAGVARMQPGTVAAWTGVSPRSTLAAVQALHSAMIEMVFDYQDQARRAQYSRSA
jgi:hypothetical protein